MEYAAKSGTVIAEEIMAIILKNPAIEVITGWKNRELVDLSEILMGSGWEWLDGTL